MGKFIFTPMDIDGLVVIEPTVFGDERGYFMETWNYRDFESAGLPMNFVQDNQSRSKKGVFRGMHFQKTNPQGKLVRVICGEVFDVAVDIRQNSPTFGQWCGVVLSSENKKQFYVPEGFAHGFLVTSDVAEFAYKCTQYYNPSDESGFRWNDKAIGIDWPIPYGMELIVNDKDKAWPDFEKILKV